MKSLIEDIFATVKFNSAIYFKHGFCGNWGMEVGQGNFAQFHFVARGNCVLQIDQTTHQISKGDLIIFPNGSPHRIKANDQAICRPGVEIVQQIINGKAPFEEGEISAHLVCGHYELDRDISHPIFDDLPKVIIIRDEDYGRFDMIDTILGMILDELNAKRIGFKIISLRFAEILFIAVLRHYYLHMSEHEKANLFSDESIYKVMNFIHENIDSELSIEKLSRHVGISRTLFIERFKNSVGNTPLAYIKCWRMTKAKQLLKYSDLPLEDIGDQVGYSSLASFSRVFKQTYNIAPKKFRLLIQQKESTLAS